MIIILSVLVLIIDQISKLIVVKSLDQNSSIEVIKSFFYLTRTNNTGAAFSILLGKRILLIIITVLVLIYVFYYLKKNKVTNKLVMLSYSLIIGGSLGNLIDRVIYGYVIDFLSFKIGTYNFPIFNLADTSLTIGVILLIIINWKGKENDSNK